MKWLCNILQHQWAFDGGKWIIKDAAITVRKCKRCGLRQGIEQLHLVPNYVIGERGLGVSILSWERRPGDKDYDEVFERNERPTE